MSINLNISIHAPTRGATIQHLKAYANTVFQSTLPREERQSQVFCCFLDNYFNPRSHERSDLAMRMAFRHLKISIHAPTRGATKICCIKPTLVKISIHAPTRGATVSSYLNDVMLGFQSTLPREERQTYLRV